MPAGEGRATGRIARRTLLHVVDAILTGVHLPGESHYELLRAFADDSVLDRVRAALTGEAIAPMSSEIRCLSSGKSPTSKTITSALRAVRV